MNDPTPVKPLAMRIRLPHVIERHRVAFEPAHGTDPDSWPVLAQLEAQLEHLVAEGAELRTAAIEAERDALYALLAPGQIVPGAETPPGYRGLYELHLEARQGTLSFFYPEGGRQTRLCEHLPGECLDFWAQADVSRREAARLHADLERHRRCLAAMLDCVGAMFDEEKLKAWRLEHFRVNGVQQALIDYCRDLATQALALPVLHGIRDEKGGLRDG